jgi:TRAP-type uncharacterized transport system substrate-binding protein
MSIKTKFAALALATLAVTGTIASTTQAQAKPLGWGIGAGLVGAAIVGTAIAASNDGYYHDGYRRCGWVRQSTLSAITWAACVPAVTDFYG